VLRRRVGTGACVAHHPTDGGCVHHLTSAPISKQQRNKDLNTLDATPQIHVDHPFASLPPVSPIGNPGSTPRRCCIRHRRPEPLQRRPGEATNRLEVPHVGDDPEYVILPPAQRRLGCPESRYIDIRQDHPGAVDQKRLSHSEPDPACRASHHCDPSPQARHRPRLFNLCHPPSLRRPSGRPSRRGRGRELPPASCDFIERNIRVIVVARVCRASVVQIGCKTISSGRRVRRWL
jgi:hypothetical protein